MTGYSLILKPYAKKIMCMSNEDLPYAIAELKYFNMKHSISSIYIIAQCDPLREFCYSSKLPRFGAIPLMELIFREKGIFYMKKLAPLYFH